MEGSRIKFFTQDEYHRLNGELDFQLAQYGTLLTFGHDNQSTIAIVRNDIGQVFYIHPEWMSFVDIPREFITSKINEVIDENVAPTLQLDAKAQINAILKKYL